MKAAANGHADVVEILLQAGADPNARRISGAAALKFAAARGHRDVVEKLLSAGADPHQADNDGHTALMSAAAYNHGEIAKILLLHGATLNAQDNRGRTALIHGHGAWPCRTGEDPARTRRRSQSSPISTAPRR